MAVDSNLKFSEGVIKKKIKIILYSIEVFISKTIQASFWQKKKNFLQIRFYNT